jgi:hypothetical protein
MEALRMGPAVAPPINGRAMTPIMGQNSRKLLPALYPPFECLKNEINKLVRSLKRHLPYEVNERLISRRRLNRLAAP